MNNDELFDWYLARLRKLAWMNESEQRPTPLTLVETDKQLLQNLVLKSSDTLAVRRDKFMESINSQTGSLTPLFLVALVGFGLILLGLIR